MPIKLFYQNRHHPWSFLTNSEIYIFPFICLHIAMLLLTNRVEETFVQRTKISHYAQFSGKDIITFASCIIKP